MASRKRRRAKKEARELGFLLLGVVSGAVLGIMGSLWVSFLVELLKNLIPPELWTLVSFLGLVITSILSIYVLVKVIHVSAKYIKGEETAEWFEYFEDESEKENNN